jgi:V8-like Glu-specific endopeptidase
MWAGTGFLVADDVIMTNHHVAKQFGAEQPSGGWRFQFVTRVSIDFIREIGATTSANFTVTEVIGAHPTLDLALLRVEQTSGVQPPTPLTLARELPSDSEQPLVYLIGYPGPPQPDRDQFLVRSIFADTYGVKRLQPGKIKEIDQNDPLFTHDCSTLGGNSGSPIIDLETGLVIGLHYAGTYLVANHAVALWKLADDPLLRAAKVKFD